MADYIVRFKIHLIPALKPEGWENPVNYDVIFTAESFKKLWERVKLEMAAIIQQRGIFILKSSDKPLEDNIETMDLRQFLPIHMIAYIGTETKQTASTFPNIGDEGVFIQ